MKQRSSRHFLFETLPKEGNKRERERESLLSILAASCSHPEVSGLRQFRMDLWHPAAPRKTRYRTMLILHVQLCQVREKLFSLFPCLIDLDCVSSRQELWQRPPPMTGSEGWWLSVSAFCARLYSFCSRAAFANLRRCETDPRKSPPNTISSHDMWEKDRKRRPHLPVFALRSSSDHKWMQSAGSTTSKGQWIQLVKSCAASEFDLETAGGWLSGFGKFLKCWMCWWFSREQDGTRWNKHSHSWSAGVPPRWLEGVTAVPPERERLLMVPWDMLGRFRNVSNLMVLFTFKMTEGRMDRRASSKPPIYNNWNQIRWYCPSDTLNEWMNEMKWNEINEMKWNEMK